MRPGLLTISSGPKGTAVYVDGVLAMASERFRITAIDCTGRLVVGTSPVNTDPWTGVLKGLAIYHRYLSAQQVVRHYETWTTKERPEVGGGERCAALYLFTESRGNRVQNRMRAGCDLLIPEQYLIQDEILLKPFWTEFALSWGYWKSVLTNIIGLVPLGFFFTPGSCGGHPLGERPGSRPFWAPSSVSRSKSFRPNCRPVSPERLISSPIRSEPGWAWWGTNTSTGGARQSPGRNGL